MVHLFRRFQQPLMIAVTILVIIAFVWLYNDTQFDKMGSDKIGAIHGRDITLAQAQRIGRKFELAQILQLQDLLGALAIRQQGAKENYIWNSLVLRHEADRLGIAPSTDELVSAIQAMPAFHTNGAYDSAKYHMILQFAVTPRGFTADDLEDLIRDDLRLRKIKALLGATAGPSESEVRETFLRFNQKIEASVVRWKLDDFLATTQVTEEDVKKAFEERAASLKSDELRKVKFVAFVLPTTDTPLDGKARAEALSTLAKQAEDFSVAMTGKGAKFEEVAAKFGAKIEETPDFPRALPPPGLGPEAAAAAYKLAEDQPNSDVVSTDRGYYVLQLSAVTTPRPLTLEEARERVTTDLKRDRAQEALGLKAAEIRNAIDTAVKAGKSFAEAAQAAGAKAEKFPAFSRQEPQMEPENSGEIMRTAAEMKAGELSPVVPAASGSVLVFVEQRLPMDEEKFKTEKTRVAFSLGEFQKVVLFSEWLKLRRAAAGLQGQFGS